MFCASTINEFFVYEKGFIYPRYHIDEAVWVSLIENHELTKLKGDVGRKVLWVLIETCAFCGSLLDNQPYTINWVLLYSFARKYREKY